jgi:hypothetical protein
MSTDPKKSAGDLKDPMHLLPTGPLRSLARVLKLGADKYGVYNWRESDGVKASTYTAAMLRHITQFMDGEDIDAESGESHLAHIMATCSILLDAERVGKLIDDRPKVDRPKAVPEWQWRWQNPCRIRAIRCANSDSPVRCGSCVERPDGWTNFVEREDV